MSYQINLNPKERANSNSPKKDKSNIKLQYKFYNANI